MRAVCFITVAVIILTVHSVESFAAPTYKFTNVYDTTMVAPGGYSFSYRFEPSLSDGKAAFLGYYEGFTRHSIFTGDGGPIVPIISDTDADPLSSFVGLGDPTINSGEVAFVGYYTQTNQGVFKYSNGVITPIVRTGDPAPANTFTAFDYRTTSSVLKFPVVGISGGTVAFRGEYNFGQEGIFAGNGGPLTTIVKSGDAGPLGPLRTFGDPAISGDTVAFVATNPRSTGVFTGNGGPLTTIAKGGDPAPTGTFGVFGEPTISGDTVAFQARFGSDQQGIFVGNGGPLTTIVKTGDPAPEGTFTILGDEYGGLPGRPPAISGDTVAFNAFYGATTYQHHGIFIHQEGINSLVIKRGDPLFGSTIRFVGMGKHGLDSDGHLTVAFEYVLEEYSQGIAFATLVPEPSSTVLLLLAAAVATPRLRLAAKKLFPISLSFPRLRVGLVRSLTRRVSEEEF
jgi:hypothetical protein